MGKIRPKAARLWRSVEANSEEESKDHQEVGAQDGVLCLQVEEPGAHQEDQTLRAGRREEEEGTDDPVLTPYPILVPLLKPGAAIIVMSCLQIVKCNTLW